ncbi:thioredoxin-like (seleno)protein SaoT [Desulfopila sp. IMCC35008]|uniref:thioredoxin-like (seleno)protein SaoT n=1 Tax=Desulfopila sp. IMCC35008 TaxID=2653858 RepID=UPI0013D2CA96|nr:thioredoxin-like (seleno)protein SaoT [Desulfopila sp. IMCC35008]
MVSVEFINTCPCCDEYVTIIRDYIKSKEGKVSLKVYYAGKDFDYIRKYGPVNKGTMIIDGKKKYDSLTTPVIHNAIDEAMSEVAS